MSELRSPFLTCKRCAQQSRSEDFIRLQDRWLRFFGLVVRASGFVKHGYCSSAARVKKKKEEKLTQVVREYDVHYVITARRSA